MHESWEAKRILQRYWVAIRGGGIKCSRLLLLFARRPSIRVVNQRGAAEYMLFGIWNTHCLGIG